MNRKQKELVARAQARFGVIRPCATCHDLTECFSQEDGRLLFWYNTQDGSTHIEVAQD
jgi:hypothetical protein